MTRCLILINRKSGNAEKVVQNKNIRSVLLKYYTEVDTGYIDGDENTDINKVSLGYDALAICGGDGTLNSAINAVRSLNIDFIYIPCGTLNDSAKCLQLTKQFRNENRAIRRLDLGEINGRLFSYVAAAGTFTAIGHTTKSQTKKRFKVFAYLLEVLREYKISRIGAEIDLDGKKIDGDFTLIMAINSKRCFGFKFNKLFKHNSGTAHLLLIKTPKGKGLLAKIRMFAPFFKAFFIGFKKQVDTENLKFLEFSKAEILLKERTPFTVDGERMEIGGQTKIKIHRQKLNLYVF